MLDMYVNVYIYIPYSYTYFLKKVAVVFTVKSSMNLGRK